MNIFWSVLLQTGRTWFRCQFILRLRHFFPARFLPPETEWHHGDAAVDKAVRSFAEKWFLPFDDVKYEALHFHDGELANESKLKDSADYAAYKSATPDAMAKFKFRKAMIDDFKEGLMAEVAPLLG